jgi:hypothetical protein
LSLCLQPVSPSPSLSLPPIHRARDASSNSDNSNCFFFKQRCIIKVGHLKLRRVLQPELRRAEVTPSLKPQATTTSVPASARLTFQQIPETPEVILHPRPPDPPRRSQPPSLTRVGSRADQSEVCVSMCTLCLSVCLSLSLSPLSL